MCQRTAALQAIWQLTSTDVHLRIPHLILWRAGWERDSNLKEIRPRYDTVYCGHVNEPLRFIKETITVWRTVLHAVNTADCVCIVLSCLYDTCWNAVGRCTVYQRHISGKHDVCTWLIWTRYTVFSAVNSSSRPWHWPAAQDCAPLIDSIRHCNKRQILNLLSRTPLLILDK
jgi:hypothetical protein